jgi:hypothetical protein
MSGLRARQVVLPLEILFRDFEVLQGHARALVAEQLDDGRKADAGSANRRLPVV